MIPYRTLTQALEANKAANRTLTYIHGERDERAVTLAELYDRALGILHYLQGQGLQPGSELILSLNDNEQLIDAFWACLFGKIVPVPLAVGISDEHRHKLFSILQRLANPFLYTAKKNLDRLAGFAQANGLDGEFSRLRARTVLVDDIHDISRPGTVHEARPEDTAFIQFSSGSTSEPKGVVISHRNLLVNVSAIVECSAMTPADSFLSWMPLTHDMGLIGFHLTPVLHNVDHYLMPTELFIRRPLLWLQKASDKRATILCSPNFGYKHFLNQFNRGKLEGMDLSQVRLIFNGAEPISASLCKEFLEAMSAYGLRRSAMYPVYGLAEASLAVAFPTPGEEMRTVRVDRDRLNLGGRVVFEEDGPAAVTLVGVGRPITDCQVRIADAENRVLEEDVIGHVQISGGNVTRGYYGGDIGSRAGFTADGWLDTGDLGFFSHGELVITGRAKDVIFFNGQNYYPHDLETIATRVDPIDLGKVAVCGVRREDSPTDEIICFVLFRGALDAFLPLAREIGKQINEHAGVDVAHVIPVGRIPKTTSGKVQRYLLGERYLKGEFAEVVGALEQMLVRARGDGSQARTMIERRLKEICGAVIAEKNVGVHDNFFEIGTSSLALAQIYERIDEAYPGALEITDFFDYPTIADLAHYLEGKLSPSLGV